MATLANFRNVVARKTGMDNTASSDEQALIDEWVNQAVTQVLLDTHCKVSKSTMALTAGQGDYDLDTDILQITRLVDSNNREMEPVQVHEMHRLRGSAQSSAATKYAVEGSNLLMVYPTPAAADVLTVYYLQRPLTLANASDTPSEVPAEFHKLIELWTLWQAGDYIDDISSHMGMDYYATYQREMISKRRYVTLKGGVRMAPARVGRRASVSSDNSRYP